MEALGFKSLWLNNLRLIPKFFLGPALYVSSLNQSLLTEELALRQYLFSHLHGRFHLISEPKELISPPSNWKMLLVAVWHSPQMFFLYSVEVKRHFYGASKVINVSLLLELQFVSVYCKGIIEKKETSFGVHMQTKTTIRNPEKDTSYLCAALCLIVVQLNWYTSSKLYLNFIEGHFWLLSLSQDHK